MSAILTMIRPGFWINPLHVTNVWVENKTCQSICFQLSSDSGNDSHNVLRDPREIVRFCEATGFVMPASLP